MKIINAPRTFATCLYLGCRYYPIVTWPVITWCFMGDHDPNTCVKITHLLYVILTPYVRLQSYHCDFTWKKKSFSNSCRCVWYFFWLEKGHSSMPPSRHEPQIVGVRGTENFRSSSVGLSIHCFRRNWDMGGGHRRATAFVSMLQFESVRFTHCRWLGNNLPIYENPWMLSKQGEGRSGNCC